MEEIKKFSTLFFAILALIILLIFSVKSCVYRNKIDDLTKSLELRENHISLLNYNIESFKHKRDTVFVRDTIYSYNSKPKYKIEKEKNDTFKPVYLDSNDLKYIKTYYDTINDSNIFITAKNDVQGKILSSQINYKLKVPFMVIDSVETIKSYNKYPKHTFGIGFITGINNLTPTLKYSYKENNFLLGYNLNTKFVTIGYIRNIYSIYGNPK